MRDTPDDEYVECYYCGNVVPTLSPETVSDDRFWYCCEAHMTFARNEKFNGFQL